MIIMGTNTWEIDIPKDMLVMQALKFAEGVKSQGIAELREFLLAYDQNLLWCTRCGRTICRWGCRRGRTVAPSC